MVKNDVVKCKRKEEKREETENERDAKKEGDLSLCGAVSHKTHIL